MNEKIADEFIHHQEEEQPSSTGIIISHLTFFAQLNYSQQEIELDNQIAVTDDVKMAKTKTFIIRNSTSDIFHPPQSIS